MTEQNKINEARSILAKYGSPCYIFHSDEYIENYRSHEKALKAAYPKYEVAYSFKTNYAPRICEIVKSLGGYAEVVSDMEYCFAKKLGYENSRIIYNGPIKGPLLAEHMYAGGIVNIDSLDELDRALSYCRENPDHTYKIGLRANIDIGQPIISRFGIDTSSSDFEDAVQKIRSCGNVTLSGLHCHISKSRTVESWARRMKIMLELADRYFPDNPPEYIDLGSGMFGVIEPEVASFFKMEIPSYEDYARAAIAPFYEHYRSFPEEKQPILFTEPGTTLDNRYVSLLSTVTAIKEVRGKTFAALDTSKFNLGKISTDFNLPLKVLPMGRPEKQLKDADFVGYTCLEYDVVYRSYSGSLAVGDCVVFGNVGGYTNVQKPPFILPQCAMVEKKSDGTISLMKRTETWQDVMETYIYEEE
ncbi:MAG TPA: hypothetical protein PLN48_11790 [Lachnospiraceae bacterium]|nr:hypothetical protein [Lachnospiraceae bacterium]